MSENSLFEITSTRDAFDLDRRKLAYALVWPIILSVLSKILTTNQDHCASGVRLVLRSRMVGRTFFRTPLDRHYQTIKTFQIPRASLLVKRARDFM